ncbi:hypothetical protein [Marilutibacter spongiae]|uniref:Lipoprotein n=1 Tax=Marilutibacter spongiae TaxID=2025720 RepID=A0A7W3Y742_9GAMM|nr:hypothetical protein [Lysobacter spongiae]MBB1061576.1 hypothetical protein [Lysobacter spongiae]
MRILTPVLPLVLASGLLAGCGAGEYHDTRDAVDARPECSGMRGETKGEPVPAWCEREQGMTWSSDDDEVELDFSGNKGDD